MSEIEFDVDVDSAIDELVAAGTRGIVRANELMARHLREEDIPREAPRGGTGSLQEDWHEREEDPLTRVVFPGRDAFYAHMIARGTEEHGPRRARALRLPDGRFAAVVAGIPPNPFHERAVAAMESRAEDLLDQALADEGIG